MKRGGFLKRGGKIKKKLMTYLGIRGYRYDGLKGVFWTIFSQYIRKRDFIKYHGKCVSCRTFLQDWKDGDAGHYIAAGRCGFGLLFDEQNVHLQCKRCNAPEITPDASIFFGYELDKRLGPGVKEELYRRSFRDITKVWSDDQYKEKIHEYIDKFNAL